MITYRDWVTALRELGIQSHLPVLIHAAPELTYESRGGTQTTLTALLSVFDDIMLPAFTYRTLVTPRQGPEDNGMVYSASGPNFQEEIFSREMSADTEIGKLSTLLINHPDARRSSHPVLSYVGIGVDSALSAQTIDEPFAPIRVISDLNGWVLLLGEDQRRNTVIHYAEFIANRKQFIRWALTTDGVVECPHMPGCSRGFNAASQALAGFCRETTLGDYRFQAFPVGSLVQIVSGLIKREPAKLLCSDEQCLCCNAVRKSLSLQ